MERPGRAALGAQPRANGCGAAHGALRNGFVRGLPGTQVGAAPGAARGGEPEPCPYSGRGALGTAPALCWHCSVSREGERSPWCGWPRCVPCRV